MISKKTEEYIEASFETAKLVGEMYVSPILSGIARGEVQDGHSPAISLGMGANIRTSSAFDAIAHLHELMRIQHDITFYWLESIMYDLRKESKHSKTLREKFRRIRREQARFVKLSDSMEGITEGLQYFVDLRANQIEASKKDSTTKNETPERDTRRLGSTKV